MGASDLKASPLSEGERRVLPVPDGLPPPSRPGPPHPGIDQVELNAPVQGDLAGLPRMALADEEDPLAPRDQAQALHGAGLLGFEEGQDDIPALGGEAR